MECCYCVHDGNAKVCSVKVEVEIELEFISLTEVAVHLNHHSETTGSIPEFSLHDTSQSLNYEIFAISLMPLNVEREDLPSPQDVVRGAATELATRDAPIVRTHHARPPATVTCWPPGYACNTPYRHWTRPASTLPCFIGIDQALGALVFRESADRQT